MTRLRGKSEGGPCNLPAELLLECLRAADSPTRVRASHVSRTWRNISISDSRLWDSFMCSKFRGERHEDAMLDKLRQMLDRSRSLPFRLGIPHHSSFRTDFDYLVRILSLVKPHFRRIALYDGPHAFFDHLSRDSLPLPALESLNIVNSDAPRGTMSIMNFAFSFPSMNLPNLRRLQVPHVYFSSNSAPLEGLKDLTCSMGLHTVDCQRLFDLCPNLVPVHFEGIDVSEVLPPVSLPRSLRTITISPKGEGLDIARLVQHWASEHLPLLVLHEARTLQGVLPLFLASHRHRVELRMNACAHELELKTIPDDGTAVCTWMITPSPLREGFLSALETRNCQRLTSISVAIEQLRRLFSAQLETPGLELLEFRLVGTQESPPLQADDDDLFIRAPRLRRIAFDLSGHVDAIHEQMDDIRRALDVLRGSCRALIVYDAELLESISVSFPAAFAGEIDCTVRPLWVDFPRL